MSTLKIKRFNPQQLKPDRICLFVGKRGTGKSTLLRDIMYHMRGYIDVPTAMTPTEDSAEMFESCMPASCVHRDFHEGTVDRIIAHQRKAAKKKKEPRHVLLVLDDMGFDKKVLKGKNMRDLFMNGRHYSVTLCLTLQYCIDMGPDLRSQIDYCFCLREPIISNRCKLWKYFFGGFSHFQDFCSVFDTCTANNECLVIDNTIKSNNLADFIFYYKASIDIPSFRLGMPQIWKLHSRFYYTEEEIEELEEALTTHPSAQLRLKIKLLCVKYHPDHGQTMLSSAEVARDLIELLSD